MTAMQPDPARRGSAVLPLTVLGVDVDATFVGANGAESLERARPLWSACCRPEGGEGRELLIGADAPVPNVLSALSSLVTRCAIEERAGQLWMLHAAAVAADDGRVVAFVGASGTGKTTIARTLGRTHGYVSDETCAVTFDGGVLPYPKPLSVGTPDAVKVQVSPPDAGMREVPPECHLGRIVLPVRDGTRHPRVEEVRTSEAIVRLVEQSSGVRQTVQPLRRLADLLARTGGAVEVRYDEASDLISVIPELLG